MLLTAVAKGTEHTFDLTADQAIEQYEARDEARVATWTNLLRTH